MSNSQGPLGRTWGGVEPSYLDVDHEPVRIKEPFTKRNWKSTTSRDAWDTLHSRMSAAKSEAEWRSVIDEETDRKAAIIHVNNHNRDVWLERVAKHDLFYRPIRYTAPYDGYSHKHMPVDRTDPERVTYAAIALEEEHVETFEHAETGNPDRVDHEAIGELLGFPKCCRRFFDEVWVKGRKLDPIYEIACNSGNAEAVDGDPNHILIKDPNPGANVMWRYTGLSFLTHLPCSWDCEDSIEVARHRYRVMCNHGYQDAADGLVEWLSQPHEWTGHKAICEVRNQHAMVCSHTTSYWQKKTVTWGGPHNPGGSVFQGHD